MLNYRNSSVSSWKLVSLTAGLLSLTLINGCRTIAPEDLPLDVAVAHVDVQQVQLMETQVRLHLRLENETVAPITVIGGSYRFYLDKRYIGKALSNVPVEVPALSSTPLTVVMNLSNLRLVERVSSVLETGRYDYKLVSHVYVSGSSPRYTIEREGLVDLKALVPQPGALAPPGVSTMAPPLNP